MEADSERLMSFYQSQSKTGRSISSGDSENVVLLILEGGEIINVEKVTECYNNLTYGPQGVKIYPTFMKFKNPSEGLHWRKKITIKNTGNKAVFVQIHKPNSMAFQIEAVKKRGILHPGLSLKVWIIYSFKRPSLLNARLPIEIDGQLINYRLISVIDSPNLVEKPTFFDFEKVDINLESNPKILTLKNIGGQNAKFSIEAIETSLKVIIVPKSGVIKPGEKIKLKVKILGRKEGSHFSGFYISYKKRIHGTQKIRVLIKAAIIIPKFEAHHLNSTGDSILINFTPTFLEAMKYETFVVKNISSRSINFIALGHINEELIDILEIDEEKYPAYRVFKISPIEGRMEPFENKIFYVTFYPTTKASRLLQKIPTMNSQDFLAFFKLIRLHVSEVKNSISEIDYKKITSDESMPIFSSQQESMTDSERSNCELLKVSDPNSINLCIHGDFEHPKLLFTPDNLYFGGVKIGEKVNRIMSISNLSINEALIYRFITNPFARCIPNQGVLEPNKKINILIEVKGKFEVEPIFKLKFEVIAEIFGKFPLMKKRKKIITSHFVKCFLNLVMESKKSSTLQLIKGSDQKEDKCFDIKLPKIKIDLPLVTIQKKIEHLALMPVSETHNLPLSTSQIFKVKVFPTTLHFGKVVTCSTGYKDIKFENKNSFSVMIRLVSPTPSHIYFPDGDLIILDSKTTLRKLVGFRTKKDGIYSGSISYIINENYSFEIKLKIEVVNPNLRVDAQEILIGKDYLSEEVYRPLFTHVEIKNELNASAVFELKMPTESSFSVKPLSGTIRGYRSLFIHMSYEPDPFKVNHTQIMMSYKSTKMIYLNLKGALPAPNVILIKPDINFGRIPLNIPTETVSVLYNANFSPSTFQVDKTSLPVGVTVQPNYGVIPPRGIKILQIILNFEACVKFAITVKVIVQNSLELKLKLSGQVSFPILKLVPDRIEIKRISADSQQIHMISATNKGETKLKLQFLLDKYPEFSISLFPEKRDSFLDEVTMNPSTTQTFYLHFTPVDHASYNFYLPILINGIIGPADIDNPKTLEPSEYLKPKEADYSAISGLTFTKIPLKWENILIYCTVAGHLISFNKKTLIFDTCTDKIQDTLIITNQSQEESSFIIRTDSFEEENSPFQICWIAGIEPLVTPISIVCTLCPEQETTFSIYFKPLKEGHFELEAPIFVRGQLDGNLYNVIKLTGDNPAATIESELQEMYFSPLPLNTNGIQSLFLTMKNFKTNSKIMVKVLNPERRIGLFTNETVQVEFPEGNSISENKKEIEVFIRVKNPEPVSFLTKLEFFDDQNTASLLVKVYGIVDNCLLSIHAYKFQNPNQMEFFDLPYPCFPINSMNRAYELHMKETILAAEEWLYSDAMKFEFYPDIIDGITAVFSNILKIKEGSEKEKTSTVGQSFFTALELLIRPNCKSFIKNPIKLPETTYERITFLLQKYGELLKFLCTQGAFLAHISPKLLLNYNDYLIITSSQKNPMQNSLKNLQDKMSKQLFESRSKQCWLDIILQTYKCFRLNRIQGNIFRPNTDKISRLHEKKSKENIINKSQKNRHTNEKILLVWLNQHFNEESKKEWLKKHHKMYNRNEKDDQLEPKSIDNFDSCFTDGLVLIAVTAAYCPFLIEEFFENIYISPKSPVEALHNAICIVTAWQKIRLGFLVNPMQIIRPNCVHMLMLITRLYTILPTYINNVKVQFSCQLNSSTIQKITITNPTNNPVTFITQFVNNKSGLFSTSTPNIVMKLKPRENKKLKIKFEARKLQETKAYLLVCGSTIGPDVPQNHTFLLEGNINELKILNEYTVTSRLYQILDTNITVNVPYKKQATYEIWLAEEEPKEFSKLRMSRWGDVKRRKIPRTLFINQKFLTIVKNASIANLLITVTCITLIPQSNWLIFRSNYADFIIEIKFKCRPPIVDYISVDHKLESCICSASQTEVIRDCPQNIKIIIPSQNRQLWNCVRKILRKILDSKEYPFWSRILDTNLGARMIQWHMGDHNDSLAKELTHLFKTSVTYDVTTSDGINFLQTPHQLSIYDVNSPKGETELTAHLSDKSPLNYETILKLKSLDKKEIRNYKVKIICQE